MERKIKILIDGMSYNIGGVETYIMTQFRKFDRKKISIDFINDQKCDTIAYQDEILATGSRLFHLHGKREWRKFMISHKGEYDFIIFNIVAPFFHNIRTCCRYGGFKRVIVHSHNGSVDVPAIVRPFIKPSMAYEHAKLARLDITKWACSKKASIWMFGSDDDYTFIKNGIETEKFAYDPAVRKEVRAELGLTDDDFVLGHIGRFDLQKNHKFLMEIFNEYHKEDKNAKLLLVGPETNRDVASYVDSFIKEHDLADSVIKLGLRNDAIRLYQAMDTFLLPSLYEGLPIVGVEAQCSGLPTLFSNTITDEVKMLDETQFLPINSREAVFAWLEGIREAKNSAMPREEGKKKVAENGFDINNEVRRVEKLLLSY